MDKAAFNLQRFVDAQSGVIDRVYAKLRTGQKCSHWDVVHLPADRRARQQQDGAGVRDLKFHSSMTLFARAAPEEPAFQAALRKFFGGKRDQATLDRLR